MAKLDAGFTAAPIAHRGLHGPGVPENSMAAFLAAIDAGYGIELDVQPASDGTPMVFHDETLARLCGAEGLIAALGPDQLAGLRLYETDQTIPTLRSVLDEVAGRVPLLIEIKDQDGALGRDFGKLVENVARMVDTYDGPAALMSFNPHMVAACAKAAPGVARGLTSCHFAEADWPRVDEATRQSLAALEMFDEVGASFVSHFWGDLGNPAIAALKSRGVPVLCWTIRTPEQEAQARAVADGITFELYRP
ncbi:MAG: glycerophosphodiester phosphodiesterase family protein [Paracoccus sp. (in: a-proteobacteria)]|nr:glycerophosphodiester phosphodiesterase family protein [Paracoccus sp. (in: a-proteobacteria)]